ncbi:hypothetical protein [Clostridium tyrobutyricum]|uniref:hypothetical protein n=1 Tax=Clostridium tyrobutyricum TaxID=1519 RepID=UPI002B21AA8F|nr:hypothetical protein [Clostridium tyrobutyricum]MEA5009344.1 hypothetical protein [Clostridium tyrobutyricum]
MSKMYIKAIVKEVIVKEKSSNTSVLQVRLEGVSGFILKSKDYKEEIKLISVNNRSNGNDEDSEDNKKDSTNLKNNFDFENINIFIDNNKIFSLKKVDEKFLIKNKMESLIKDIFVSQKPCIFGLEKKDDKYEITSIRKCD